MTTSVLNRALNDTIFYLSNQIENRLVTLLWIYARLHFVVYTLSKRVHFFLEEKDICVCVSNIENTIENNPLFFKIRRANRISHKSQNLWVYFLIKPGFYPDFHTSFSIKAKYIMPPLFIFHKLFQKIFNIKVQPSYFTPHYKL